MLTASTKPAIGRFIVVCVFSAAFAYIESAVVVYLREIFHPAGFVFPLTDFVLGPMPNRLLLVEIGREAATLVLILTGCVLIGRTRSQRVAYFLTIFAVWDIFYYIWLKVFLDWPASIMEWDILFLIPAIWASPVLAPVIVSVMMLTFAMVILYRDHIGAPVSVKMFHWIGFIVSALIIVVSFCLAGRAIALPEYADYLNWKLFWLGEFSAIATFVHACRK